MCIDSLAGFRGLMPSMVTRPLMSLKDFILQINITLRTTKKQFKFSKLYILSILFLLVIALINSHLLFILYLYFKDINILLI